MEGKSEGFIGLVNPSSKIQFATQYNQRVGFPDFGLTGARPVIPLQIRRTASNMQVMFDRLAAARLRHLARRFPRRGDPRRPPSGQDDPGARGVPGSPYCDLEDPRTAQLFRDDPRHALAAGPPGGLVLDEVQRVPAVFGALRGAIDAGRDRMGRFILLRVSPARAGARHRRIPGGAGCRGGARSLTAGEAGSGNHQAVARPVAAGRLPGCAEGDFREWWEQYLRMLLERDLPRYGIAADPLFLRRLLTMLAHQQGGLFNASALGASLGVSYHTVQRYVDVLQSVFLVRRLPPFFRNVGKRLAKAPKVICGIPACCTTCSTSAATRCWRRILPGGELGGFVIEDILRRERLAHPASAALLLAHRRRRRNRPAARPGRRAGRGGEVKTGHGGQSRALHAARRAARRGRRPGVDRGSERRHRAPRRGNRPGRLYRCDPRRS